MDRVAYGAHILHCHVACGASVLCLCVYVCMCVCALARVVLLQAGVHLELVLRFDMDELLLDFYGS